MHKLAAMLLLLATPLSAAGLETRGEAKLRWFGFTIYTAKLFTPMGQPFGWDAPLALELNYADDFSGQSILDATRREMARIEGGGTDLSTAITALKPCFPDVAEGDRLRAEYAPQMGLKVLHNGAQQCYVPDDALAQRFLAIWLSEDARDQRLSKALRGL